jgi:methionyl aminopeptidase
MRENGEEKAEDKLSAMRFVSETVAYILKELKEQVQVGMTGLDCEKIACEIMKKKNVQSSTFGYRFGRQQPFPNYICVSINEELTHGIPDNRVFKEGDLVSFDVACNYKGYHGDAALTTIIGEGDKEKENLLRVTKSALEYVIETIKPNITTTKKIGEVL